MSVEMSYRVIHLSRQGGSVKMVLEEVRLVPPEEIERARLEAEKKPEIDVVDEGEQFQKMDLSPKPKTQMEEVFSAMRTQFPEFAEIFKSESSPVGIMSKVMTARGPVPLYQQIEMHLTLDQYKELGNPPLLSIIKVSMKLEE